MTTLSGHRPFEPLGRPSAPPPADAPGDDTLVARMRAGDEAALGLLYDRYHATCHALAHAIAGPEDAEDAVLATFVQLWEGAGRYDPARGSVASWVVMVARSRALDLLRRRRRLAGHAARFAAEAEGAGAGADGPDAADSPDVAVERHELAAAVRGSLGALPSEQRRVIELAFFAGLSHGAIAEFLGEPLGTVKSRIRLGMSKLRGALVAWAPGGP